MEEEVGAFVSLESKAAASKLRTRGREDLAAAHLEGRAEIGVLAPRLGKRGGKANAQTYVRHRALVIPHTVMRKREGGGKLRVKEELG